MTSNASTDDVNAEIDRILLLDLKPGERLYHEKKRAWVYSFVRVDDCDEILGRKLVVLKIKNCDGTGIRRFDWTDIWFDFRRGNGRES
jgi:hypothetical protein